MFFRVVDSFPIVNNEDEIYLINNTWDDWFEYETMYQVVFCKTTIGYIRIGRQGQTERRAVLPIEFETLPEGYFSLGTSVDYYSNLRGYEFREEVLLALNDLAFNLDLFEEVRRQRVTRISLLREITPNMVRTQLNRIALGGAPLTNYDFKYILPSTDIEKGGYLQLDFQVDIVNKTPPSNIHVLIGNNGIGKTTIIKSMIHAMVEDMDFNNYGKIETGWSETFSNIVNISFSAFDMPIFNEQLIQNRVPYTYVGLIKNEKTESGDYHKAIQNRDQLFDSFFSNFYTIIMGQKKSLWNNAINILEVDDVFKALDIKAWGQKHSGEYDAFYQQQIRNVKETEKQFINRVNVKYYKNKIEDRFKCLSSGHKNILLTMASLINLVEEKTLVLLDEPEEHLHPPLVAAFIRALSELLTYRNGVAIIATHSPVIVQEVPKKCVWILRGAGRYRKFERPEIETFGENLGEITTEIFKYEVLNSGFHKMIKEVALKSATYEDALQSFQGELGSEAKSILMSYMYEKE